MNYYLYIYFNEKLFGGGVETGTSTGDNTHGAEQNNERTESGPGELITTENSPNDEVEITTGALQNGK